ncbi:hypothetical protein K0T92_10840 [Paenibacillus oenotherae]|uniref:Uncharacterized protein n=1 Tax=Paenibacillus oenotherae TaxID=1435645 RepID=A0ABS7D634_9BACL|nr:hypothetical protein [Paenibacillus oenotherae]MBW7475243.1 hypothetical protein [Paenibacillus oenotherae]
MKRSYRGVVLLSLVLFLNIVCTQQTVNAYYYEKYETVILFCGLNLLLFPVAFWIYKRERDVK